MSARTRVSLVRWEGGSHKVLFMLPLSFPGARSMVQVLRLPFDYYYYYKFKLEVIVQFKMPSLLYIAIAGMQYIYIYVWVIWNTDV